MRVRHAVLPTRSVSSRPTHLRTSSQNAHESPQIPFFVFKRVRTLSFSVSSKSFPCHSYENSRVCTNNSQSGTEHPIRMRVLSERSEPKDLSPSFASCATPATHHYTQVLSFQTLAHSFALSCTLRKLNPCIFRRFCTLCQNHPGWREGPLLVGLTKSFSLRRFLLPAATLAYPPWCACADWRTCPSPRAARRRSRSAEFFLVLPQEKLVGHARDIVAHDFMPRLSSGQLGIKRRHRRRVLQVVREKLFEAPHRAVAVFRDRGMLVNTLVQEPFQLRVARGNLLAEARQPLRRAADILRAGCARFPHASLGRFNQIRRQEVQDAFQRFVEFEFLARLRIGRVHVRIHFTENCNFRQQCIRFEKLCLARIVQIRGVVGDLIHPVDELRFERRAGLDGEFATPGEMRPGGIV